METWRSNLYVCLFGSFTTIASMTMILPFLPLFVAHLGVTTPPQIVEWSGLAFGATFFGAALVSPMWGRLADRYGRKPMLVRASLGMACTMSLLGLAENVYQLVGLRLLAGLLGGYASGAVIMVATQTPKERAGWALGTLSTGTLAGSLIGPLIGGALPELIGIRQTFFAVGGAIFVAAIATITLLREHHQPSVGRARVGMLAGWRLMPSHTALVAMLVTAMLLLLANMSIEPIITLYVGQIAPGTTHLTLIAGLAMSATAFGAMLAAPWIGRLADQQGPWRVLLGSLLATAVLLIPQAWVGNWQQLVILRFAMGITLAGMLPCVTLIVRHSVPDHLTGTALGFSQSAQYVGQIAGPVLGGFLAGHFGMRSIFYATAVTLCCGALWTSLAARAPGAPLRH